MSESGAPRLLVARADVVPDVDRHHLRGVVGSENDLQPIGEREVSSRMRPGSCADSEWTGATASVSALARARVTYRVGGMLDGGKGLWLQRCSIGKDTDRFYAEARSRSKDLDESAEANACLPAPGLCSTFAHMLGLLARLGRRTLLRSRARVDRFKLASRKHVRLRLMEDDVIAHAVRYKGQ